MICVSRPQGAEATIQFPEGLREILQPLLCRFGEHRIPGTIRVPTRRKSGHGTFECGVQPANLTVLRKLIPWQEKKLDIDSLETLT